MILAPSPPLSSYLQSERLSCAEALDHPWLQGSGNATSKLSSAPLPGDLKKKRRESLEIRSALQGVQGAANFIVAGRQRQARRSEPTAAFQELEQMRSEQEKSDAVALQQLMEKLDAEEVKGSAALRPRSQGA